MATYEEWCLVICTVTGSTEIREIHSRAKCTLWCGVCVCL